MNIQYEETRLLKLVREGDAAAAETILSLVGFNSLRHDQFAEVLLSASMGASAAYDSKRIDGKPVEDLAKIAAWKMPMEAVQELKGNAIAALKNPDSVKAEVLDGYIGALGILMEQHRLKNCDLIDLAEAVAEGLSNTKDAAKLAKLKIGAGERVRKRLPDDVERIYEAVYHLATRPGTPRDHGAYIVLTAYLRRAERGEVALELDVINRLEKALSPAPKPAPGPLSDGDMNLPKPPMARQAPRTQSAQTKLILRAMGSKLAQRGKPTRP